MDNPALLIFEAIVVAFTYLPEIGLTLLIGSGVFYALAAAQEVWWAVSWESKRKKRVVKAKKPVKAVKAQTSKKSPKNSAPVVSDFSDEYKLPSLPFD